MSSPYKKLKVTNQAWVGYINICRLDENKLYQILGIVATDNPKYGPGQQATILGHDGKKWRTQLPGKYLANLNENDINQMKKDISNGQRPYLIYRETMMDKSYRIDIVPFTKEYHAKFLAGEHIDELEDSLVLEEDAQDKEEQEISNQEDIRGESQDSDDVSKPVSKPDSEKVESDDVSKPVPKPDSEKVEG